MGDIATTQYGPEVGGDEGNATALVGSLLALCALGGGAVLCCADAWVVARNPAQSNNSDNELFFIQDITGKGKEHYTRNPTTVMDSAGTRTKKEDKFNGQQGVRMYLHSFYINIFVSKKLTWKEQVPGFSLPKHSMYK